MSLPWLTLDTFSQVYLSLQRVSEHFSGLDCLMRATSQQLAQAHQQLARLADKLALPSQHLPALVSATSACADDLVVYLRSTSEQLAQHHTDTLLTTQRSLSGVQKEELEALLNSIQKGHLIQKSIASTQNKYLKQIKKFDKCYEVLLKTQSNANTLYNTPLRNEQHGYLLESKAKVMELEKQQHDQHEQQHNNTCATALLFHRLFSSYQQTQVDSIHAAKSVLTFWLQQNEMVVQSVSDFLQVLLAKINETVVSLSLPSPLEFDHLLQGHSAPRSPPSLQSVGPGVSPSHSVWPDFLRAPHKIPPADRASFMNWLLLYKESFLKRLEGRNNSISTLSYFFEQLVGVSGELMRQQQKQSKDLFKKLDQSLLGRENKALLQAVKAVMEQSSRNLPYIAFLQEQFRNSGNQRRDTLLQRSKELKASLQHLTHQKTPFSQHSLTTIAQNTLEVFSTHLKQDSLDLKGLQNDIGQLLHGHTKMLSGLAQNIRELSELKNTYSHPTSLDSLLAHDQTYTHIFSTTKMQELDELAGSPTLFTPLFNLSSYDLKALPELAQSPGEHPPSACHSLKEIEEKALHAYSCALSDQYTSHGTLFLLEDSLFFHSLFNGQNLFFGTTKMKIPGHDILEVKKQKQLLVMNNALEVTTTNGSILFTNFFSRDKAYERIVELLRPAQQPELLQPSPAPLPENSDSKWQPTVLTEQQAQAFQERSKNVAAQLPHQDTYVEKHDFHKDFPSWVSVADVYRLLLAQDYFLGDQTEHTWLSLRRQSGSYDLSQVSAFDPASIPEYFQNNSDLPAVLGTSVEPMTREYEYKHPVEAKVPFLPKFCTINEKQQLWLVGQDELVMLITTRSKGVPYSDCWSLQLRYHVHRAPLTRLSVSCQVLMIKNTIMESKIKDSCYQGVTLFLKEVLSPLLDTQLVRASTDPLYKKRFLGHLSELPVPIQQEHPIAPSEQAIPTSATSFGRFIQLQLILVLLALLFFQLLSTRDSESLLR